MNDQRHALSPPAPREGIESDHHLSSAEEFLRALSPMHELWGNDPSEWIYRGHANADWELKAKAVRLPKDFHKYSIDGDASGWSQRKSMLDSLLQQFRTRLDRAGIPVPQQLPSIDGTDRHKTSSSTEPDHEAFPLMALAQHHGLPTLFLDWTRRARNAAYFAAVDAASVEKQASHLAVWALRAGHDVPARYARGIFFYHAPGATNPNLRAQSGLFTLTRPEAMGNMERAAYVDLSLEQQVAGQFKEKATLRRLTLPTAEAPRLLRLLSYEGIDGASMFPGADGVVRAMRETALWDRRDGGGERT